MIYGYLTLHYPIIFILSHISFPLLMYHFKYFPKIEISRSPSLIRTCMNLYFWLAYSKCEMLNRLHCTNQKYNDGKISIIAQQHIENKYAYGYWKSFTCDCFTYYWLFMEMSFCWRVPWKLSKQLIIHKDFFAHASMDSIYLFYFMRREVGVLTSHL